MDNNVNFLTPRSNFIKEDKTIWTVLVKENVVVRCNMDSDKAEAVAAFRFGFEGINGKLGYWFIDKYKNKIFLNLTAESSIKILDTDCFRWDKVQIGEDHVQPSREDLKFWTSFCHGGYYWKVGFSYPGIVKMNIETNHVTYINSWIEQLKRICCSTDLDVFFGYGYCIRDDHVFLPVYRYAIILEMNMSTFECVFHEYPIKYKGFRVLSGDSNDIWAETLSGDLVRIDRSMSLSELKNTTGLSIKNINGEAFWKPVILGSKVLFLPHFYNRVLEADKVTMEIKQSNLNNLLPGVSEGKIYCIESVQQGNFISFFYRNDDGSGTYCEYDTQNESVITRRFLLEENDIQHTAWLLNIDKNVMPETTKSDLRSLITAVLNDEKMNETESSYIF